MNCAEYKELLVGYLEGLLDSPQSETVRLHLNNCAACRKELEQLKAIQNRLVANGHLVGQNDLENAVMDRILREQAFQLRKTKETKQHLNFWRYFMRNRIGQLAAAAAIILAVLAAIYFITGKTPSVTCCTWAQIADKVEQIKTCICKMHIKQTGGPLGVQDVDSMMFISSEFGNRMDTYTNGNLAMQAYVLPKDKVIITVMPPAKKYMLMNLTDDYMSKMNQQGQNPQDMVKAFALGQYTNLGRSTIDGVVVEGIQVVNPPAVSGIYENFTGKLWVDVATEFPVRLEFEAQMSVGAQKIQISMVMNDFEWQTQLDPEVFEPNIPSDYTMMAELNMPGQDEGDAIEGLRIFAEVADGNYPSSLNMTTLIQEATQSLTKKMNLTAAPTDEQTNQMMQKMMKIQGIFLFYNNLAQTSKDPAYYGKDVKASDTDAVLMRWKTSDDTYRVIYGDLTAEDVNAGQLKEMEQPTSP